MEQLLHAARHGQPRAGGARPPKRHLESGCTDLRFKLSAKFTLGLIPGFTFHFSPLIFPFAFSLSLSFDLLSPCSIARRKITLDARLGLKARNTQTLAKAQRKEASNALLI